MESSRSAPPSPFPATLPADPLPSPPFVTIPGVANFRDVGGYPVASPPGRIVKPNVMYRSAEPSQVTEEGICKLQALGITHVFDLRSPPELVPAGSGSGGQEGGGSKVKEWAGAQRLFVPVFLARDYSPEAIARRFRHYTGEDPDGFTKTYTDILLGASSPSHTHQPFRAILEHLSSLASPPPFLVHCTAGKDRTGVVVALVLGLCGAPDDVIAHEYSLTDLGLREGHEQMLAGLLAGPALGADEAGARRMMGARKENMLGFLKMIRDRWGSVEQCVLDLGLLTAERIKQLRENLIVDMDMDMGRPVELLL